MKKRRKINKKQGVWLAIFWYNKVKIQDVVAADLYSLNVGV